MHTKITAFIFALALMAAIVVPLFGRIGTAEAIVHTAVPVCNALAHTDQAAGTAAEGKVPTVGGIPLPATKAQGAVNSAPNSPGAPAFGGFDTSGNPIFICP